MFKDNLRAYREKVGMTAKSVADRAGIADTTYRNYENSNREPDYKTLKKIADVLGVTVDMLLDEDGPGEMIYDTSKVKKTGITDNIIGAVGKVFLKPEHHMLVRQYERASRIDRDKVWAILNEYNEEVALTFCSKICAEREVQYLQGEITEAEFHAWILEAEEKRDQVIDLKLSMREFREWAKK